MTPTTQSLEQLAEKCERRRNIYLAKRNQFDPFADDTETVWGRYDFAAEAIEWMASDLGVSLPDRPKEITLAALRTQQEVPNDGR